MFRNNTINMNSNMIQKLYERPMAGLIPLSPRTVVCTSGSEGQVPSYDEKIVYTEDF